ncbi:hypothetical protein PUR71_10740 [Streptomyces sp. SP17BM10]|uniref:hypothetical protein n=1 Tax=Streptomyces sp. SP17BM10 TaxID=3002530 RepID=UPI002E77143A|nr:hypothetical protein [Streptomyces sp. SP17BM10]MEE1783387.1 hypothetical protein [Streptomyces sp. SP17BM10]
MAHYQQRCWRVHQRWNPPMLSVLGHRLLGPPSTGGFVYENSLTVDIPLGPFEGTPVTVHSAKGRNAKLHTTTDCSLLRTAAVTEARLPLDVATVERLCAQCWSWGPWTRSGSGLGVFLRALGGVGLLFQLHCYAGPDEDVHWDSEEVQAAADLLRSAVANQEDNEDDEAPDEDGRRDAEWLRNHIFDRWRAAAQSLHQAESTAAMFPWLADWVKPKLAAKKHHLEELRGQAAAFVDATGLLTGAAAAGMSEPDLPVNDPAFGALGKSGDIAKALTALWRGWQAEASPGRDGSARPTYAVANLMHGIRSNRKGYDQAREAAELLVASWVEHTRTAVAAADPASAQPVKVTLPEIKEKTPHRPEHGFLHDVDSWTLGVLVTYLTDADWGRRTLTLHVPALVAERLLARSWPLACELRTGGTEPENGDAHHPVSNLQPGLFDDTPVLERLPVTAEHLRALRTFAPDADQLFIVFSTSGGAEVLPLAVIEKRLADGWQGVIIAGASDLPASLIHPWAERIGARPETGTSLWPQPVPDADDPRFGAELGLEYGELRAAWLAFDDRDRERNLRLLAILRSVHDLRTVDGGYDRDGHRRTVPSAVWHGLLAEETLDLEPFESGTGDWRRRGSGIPLGVLTDVQIYTTNANPRIQGKGHSPLCRHSNERGVAEDDDVLTPADLLGREDLDYHWCSKCGGYAVRRLTDTQLSYYRAAHRLHLLARDIDQHGPGHAHTDPKTTAEQLAALADWHPIGESHWSGRGSRKWRRIVNDLQNKAQALQRRDAP